MTDVYPDAGTVTVEYPAPTTVTVGDGLTYVTITSPGPSVAGGGAELGTALPIVNGTAAAGTATAASHEDHIHPTDTSRAADSAVVKLTGNQTVAGIKTWTGRQHFHAPIELYVASANPANPETGDVYYNDQINQVRYYDGNGWDTVMCLDDAQTITGNKSFAAGALISNGVAVDTSLAGKVPILRVTGSVAETFPRVGAPMVGGSSLQTGKPSSTAVWLHAGQVITSISFPVTVTASLAGQTNQWFALANSARQIVAVTADDGSNPWSASATKTLNLTSPYTVPTTGLYYVLICVTATTMVRALYVASDTVVNGISPAVAGLNNVTQSAPPTVGTTLGSWQVSATMHYSYLS